MNTLQLLQQLEQEKRVNLKKHPIKNMYIAKYTKEQFFRHEWNDLVIDFCRGHVYSFDGRVLSMPMKKVFNINEHHTTSMAVVKALLKEYSLDQIELIEKLNGHLCILFFDGEEWINTTSGTFDGEFVPKDRELLEECGFIDFLNNNMDEFQSYTFCFEIIASYDKHLMFDQTLERTDGKDTAFLLYAYCANKGDIFYDDLMIISQKSNIVLPRRFPITDESIIDDLLNHENTEGYILRFPNNLRVKFKTNWYLAERAKRGFDGGKKIKDIFAEIGDAYEAYMILPEEYHLKYAEIIAEYNRFSNLLYEKSEEMIDAFKTIIVLAGNDDPNAIFKFIDTEVKDNLIKQICFDCLRKKSRALKMIKKFFIESSPELFE